jgi:glycosyltransferase involved in cell wall biosynthesis
MGSSQHRVLDKKVLIATPLFPPDIGGPATYSKLLLEELPKYGNTAEVASFGSVRHLPKGIRHIAYFMRLIKGSKQYDTIYAQDPVSVGFPAALAAGFLGKRFVLKVVGDYAWEQLQNQESRIKNQGAHTSFVDLDNFQHQKFDLRTEARRFVQKFVARRADTIIVPSKYLKKIVSLWGIDERKIHIIYNSFDAPPIELSKEEARKKLGLTGTILISAGRLVPWKGFNTLINLMPKIMTKIPDVKLVIIGDGPDKARLALQVAKHGLHERVVHTGQLTREQLLTYMKAGDYFMLNTGYEGLSHILLEAMSMEIPVISTRVCGNPEVITHGHDGLLVGYNDGDALVKTLFELYRNPELCKNIKTHALYTLRDFSKDKMISQTIKLL